MSLPEARLRPPRRSVGIGYRAGVRRGGATIGRLLDDPFVVVEGGVVASAGGRKAAVLLYEAVEGRS